MRIISGKWRGRIIDAPPGRKTRPTSDRVREAWMSAIQHEIPNAHVLDLFAGSGALGIEALSRGAKHVTFVERALPVIRTLKNNLTKLRVEPESFTIVKTDAIGFAAEAEKLAYHIALADPPYNQGFAAELLQSFSRTPFATWFWVEHEASETLPPLAGADTRKYGDTALTSITAPE
ncbi:MAG TPA: 16S rRNA (guanine(966)-N(2))-methyltransferase RsmD [Longimicrobiales bacterium]|nr:16S rRNA (guanine(966)-N(2))-methyltransferase RsmD [Longimicrobiales bacterium]